MRKILIALGMAILLCSNLYAQTTKIEIKNFKLQIRGDEKICNAWAKFDVCYMDNSRHEIFFKNYEENTYYEPDNIYTINGIVKSIYVEVYTREKTGTTCKGDDTEIWQKEYINLNGLCGQGSYHKYVKNNGSDWEADNELWFDYNIYPVINVLYPVSENIGFNDIFSVNLTPGFQPDAYTTQYQVTENNAIPNSGDWLELDFGFQKKSKFDITLSNFIADNISNKKIWFRSVTSCNLNYISNPVFYTVLKSAPHITSKQVSETKCYDTSDGSITLNFDRKLIAGETLKASIVNTTTGIAQVNEDITDALQNSTTVSINNLPRGNYKVDLMGEYDGHATYTDGDKHTDTFEVKRPTIVEFKLDSKTDVYCHQGSDGIINISATGGQSKYQYSAIGDNGINIGWTNFNNVNKASIASLPAGTYQITVRDTNLCPAKENGNIKILTVKVSQPSAPIALSETEIKEPTGYGLSNGYISVRVTGGTKNTDGSYNFEWRKDSPSGTVISKGITTDAINNPFSIKLGNITAGKYYLTVKDKNYGGASSNLGTCGIISKEYEVTQPKPLIVKINVKKIISCNIQNEYAYKLDLDNNGIPDEAENGELTATVTGGVGKYTYQWQNKAGNSFQHIAGATKDALTKLAEGTYKILIKDANDNATEAIFDFKYPTKLQISLSANTIKCNNLNEGIVSVTATGGTGAHTYVWNTTDTSSKVTGLPAGNYFVVVQDANKCTVNGNIKIEQPGQLAIDDILVQNPVCYGASNGAIQIKVSGGKTPYSIVWSNGKTGENLSGLKAGTYNVTFTDANGCVMTKSYNLTNPPALKIDLGKDITLCQGDTQTYDIKIDDPKATYQWINNQGTTIGNTSSMTLSSEGVYTAKATDSKGCTATDQVEIKNSMAVLSPEFMIASHAYVDRTVELVNTSSVKPEKVEWVLPESNDISIISESDEHIELRFSQTGSYKIGLRGIQGQCDKTIFKDILIEENINGVEEPATASSNIKDFIIVPNPNDGNYKIIIHLYKDAAIKLRIVSLSGYEPYRAVSKPKAMEFEVPFNQTLPTGTYLIILETGTDVQVQRMLVNY